MTYSSLLGILPYFPITLANSLTKTGIALGMFVKICLRPLALCFLYGRIIISTWISLLATRLLKSILLGQFLANDIFPPWICQFMLLNLLVQNGWYFVVTLHATLSVMSPLYSLHHLFLLLFQLTIYGQKFIYFLQRTKFLLCLLFCNIFDSISLPSALVSLLSLQLHLGYSVISFLILRQAHGLLLEAAFF